MDSPVVRRSVTLLRSTSRTFTGGASAVPHHGAAPSQDAVPSETTPIRQTSGPLTRQMSRAAAAQQPTQDAVQQRMGEEVMALVTGNLIWIILFAVIGIALLFTMLVLFALAFLAVIHHNDKPCDQPLKYYLLVGIVWSQVPGYLTELIGRDWALLNKFYLTLTFSVPGWFLMAWGVFMINSAETCQKTNPGLYYPTMHYVYGQIVFSCFCLCFAIFTACGMRRFLLTMNSLIVKPGCEAAVHKLPKVEAGSMDLISSDDGEELACPICMEVLLEAVKTPCSHLFHEECLAKWCKNHVDCPLCRETVGEIDSKNDEQGQP